MMEKPHRDIKTSSLLSNSYLLFIKSCLAQLEQSLKCFKEVLELVFQPSLSRDKCLLKGSTYCTCHKSVALTCTRKKKGRLAGLIFWT